eukprot:3451114-Rhodomonas_salina.4
MSGTHQAHGASLLRARYAMSGTHLAYGMVPENCLPLPPKLPCTDTACGAARRDTQYYPVLTWRMALQGCATLGTDLAYATTSLRACYAMSGADLAYGATRSAGQALTPTANGVWYLPTRFLRDVRY